jgi:hypothetical protein
MNYFSDNISHWLESAIFVINDVTVIIQMPYFDPLKYKAMEMSVLSHWQKAQKIG